MNKTKLLLVVVALGLAVFLSNLTQVQVSEAVSIQPANAQPRNIVGTWSDPHGEPGNQLQLLQLPTTQKQSAVPAGVRVLDNLFTIENQFGIRQSAGAWSYESFQPLRLSLIIDGKPQSLAIAFQNDDRIEVTFAGSRPVHLQRAANTLPERARSNTRNPRLSTTASSPALSK